MFRSKSPWIAALTVALTAAGRAGAAPGCPSAGFVLVEAKASPETRPVQAGPRGTIFVNRTPITTTADLAEIKLDGDDFDTAVQLKFTPEAAKKLHDATTAKDGLHIAFVVDDLAMGAVTWTGPYGMDADQGVQLSLGAPVPEVRPVVEALRKCLAANAR